MRYPLKMTVNLSRYVASKKMRGTKKFPMVLMLEPLHACNLTCTGCGRIREYKSTINEMLSVEECLAAVDDCGSPVVSICGGEPLIYPEIGKLTKEILARGRHIILCTNGMFIKKKLHEFKPSSSFFWKPRLWSTCCLMSGSLLWPALSWDISIQAFFLRLRIPRLLFKASRLSRD